MIYVYVSKQAYIQPVKDRIMLWLRGCGFDDMPLRVTYSPVEIGLLIDSENMYLHRGICDEINKCIAELEDKQPAESTVKTCPECGQEDCHTEKVRRALDQSSSLKTKPCKSCNIYTPNSNRLCDFCFDDLARLSTQKPITNQCHHCLFKTANAIYAADNIWLCSLCARSPANMPASAPAIFYATNAILQAIRESKS